MNYLFPVVAELLMQGEQIPAPYSRERMVRKIREGLGGPDYGDGTLQKQMNRQMDKVLKRLRKDLPCLSDQEYFAYTYFVAGFDNILTAQLAGLPSASAAGVLKRRLKDRILLLHSPYKFEYLELLLPQ